MRRVVLHVGLPKTGTSFVQQVLRHNADDLDGQGVHLPESPQDLFLAVLHLTGRSASWGRSDEAGRRAWDRIRSQLQDRPGTAVLSSETLCLARPQQVARILSDLGDVETDVVITVRDPGRQLPAEWQEGLKHGRHASYERFLDSVLGEPASVGGKRGGKGAALRHRRFWSAQDPVAVLDRWGAGLPPSRLHVVVGPRPGAAADELWRRFAPVLDLDPSRCAIPEGEVNVSLGAVQLEVLRRVNRRFQRKGREQSYGTVAKRLYAGRILRGQHGEKVTLPPERYSFVDQLAQRWIGDITGRGWQVHGDLEELRPSPAAPSGADGVTQTAMLGSALDATAELLVEIERLNHEVASLRSPQGAATSNGERPALGRLVGRTRG